MFYWTQSPRNISKIFWTYLHLGFLDRVAAILRPTVPAHSLTVVLTTEVQTIQIGVETTVVPPGAFPTQGTADTPLVIITILGGKWHTTMITKGITSVSYKKGKKAAKYMSYFSGTFRRVFQPVNFHSCISNLSPLYLIQTGRNNSRI